MQFMQVKTLERLNASTDAGVLKVIFVHLRNFLICAFLLSIGTNEVKQHSSLLFGLLSSEYTGYGVFALATVLILYNLYDGVRKISNIKYQISNIKYHVLMTIVLVSLYVFFPSTSWKLPGISGSITEQKRVLTPLFICLTGTDSY